MKDGRYIPLEVGIAAILFTAPWLFGAVYPWGALGVTAFLFFLIGLYPQVFFALKNLPHFFLIGITVLFGWVLIQSFGVSINPYQSQSSLLQWLANGCLVAAILCRPRHRIVTIAKVIVLLGVAESLYSLFVLMSPQETVLGIPKQFHLGYATGSYFNRNHLAGLLELSLGLHLGLWLNSFSKRDGKGMIGWGILLMIPLLVLLKTGSRMGIFGFSIALLLMSLFLWNREFKESKLFLVFVVLILGICFFWKKDAVLSRLGELTDHWTTWEGRLTAWQDVMRMFANHLWVGTGLGNFKWVFPRYQSDVLTWGWSNAHNDYLELATNLGLPFMILFFFTFLFLIIWALARLRESDHYFPFAWGGFISLVAMLIHNITDFNFAIPANTLLFFAILAIMLRLLLGRRHERVAEVKDQFSVLFSFGLKVIVAVVCITLGTISAKRAWAGFYGYQADLALSSGNDRRALTETERGLRKEPLDPELIYHNGLAAWNLAKKENNKAWFRAAEAQFEKLIQQVPSFGKAWLYWALSSAELEEMQGGGLIPKVQWVHIHSLFEHAHDAEPESAWMNYSTGIYQLRYGHPYLSAEERKRSLNHIRAAILISPSRYLKPALTFLSGYFRDLDMLKEVTPHSYEAYQILINTLKRREYWKEAAIAYGDYFVIKTQTYDDLVERGKRFLQEKDFERACEPFEKALWIDSKRSQAKAGLLVCESEKNQLKKDYEEMLVTILESEDEDIDGWLAFLSSVVARSKDPYLNALHQYRSHNFEAAAQTFAEVGAHNKITRRFMAEALAQIGQKQQAYVILQEALKEENPDLRDLRLLRDFAGIEQEKVDQKILTTRTLERPAKAWWGKGFQGGVLDHQGSVGLLLNLEPEAKSIILSVKSLSADPENGGIVLLRLHGKILGVVYVGDSNPQEFKLNLKTSGGKRWLQAELLNASADAKSQSRARVELGDVKIQ